MVRIIYKCLTLGILFSTRHAKLQHSFRTLEPNVEQFSNQYVKKNSLIYFYSFSHLNYLLHF